MSGKIAPQHLRYHLPNAGKQFLLNGVMFFVYLVLFFAAVTLSKLSKVPRRDLAVLANGVSPEDQTVTAHTVRGRFL